MSIAVSTRRKHSTLSLQLSLPLGDGLVIDNLKNQINHILNIKQRLSLEDTFFNGNIKRTSLREVSGVRNDYLYEQGVIAYGNEIAYIKNIHDTLISTIWENVISILDKNLSSKEVRALNRHLATQIDQTEMKLSSNSKEAVTQALQSKIGNRFDFVGPLNTN